jgi:hypothetical protein
MSEFDAILDNEAAPLTHFYDAGGRRKILRHSCLSWFTAVDAAITV